MDSGIRVAACKTGDRRLLDKIFESKPIKRGGKILSRQLKKSFEFLKAIYQTTMSFPTANNNTFNMAPTSPNPYVSRKLNNMDQAQIMKKEKEDWERLYHKMLKGIEMMIDIQRVMKDMKKLAGEAGTTVAEMEGNILMASINNCTTNATNITQMAEDLRYLTQSNMDNRAFQIQRRLADELDRYKGRGNSYVKEVILIRPYEVSTTTSSSSTSFITDEVEHLLKHMKFV